MKEFLRERLHIALDGVLHVNEVIAIAILVVALLLVILLVCDTVKNDAAGKPGSSAIGRTGIRADWVRKTNIDTELPRPPAFWPAGVLFRLCNC